MSHRKIILTTAGTLGDLHPFIAIALALKPHGFHPVMAVPADHIEKCNAAGLEAIAVYPPFEDLTARLGFSEVEATQRLMANQTYMMEQVILPYLSTSAAALDVAAADAEAIIGSQFMFAAPMIAQKHKIPLITTILQPMAMLSPYDPPYTPDFWMMWHTPVPRLGRFWNNLVFDVIRKVLRYRYAKQVAAVRVSHGLPAHSDGFMFEQKSDTTLTLCCYSSQFGQLQPDVPAHTKLVGFPIFDSASGAPEALDPALEAFLEAGPPPLVFTLGSFAVYAPGNFYHTAAEVARKLGRRAVLLTGDKSVIEPCSDVFICPYAPHSNLFAHAAAVVHHGGVGTTGQALKAGKPQIVVPYFGDQYDNARRIRRLGVGVTLAAKRFTEPRALAMIAKLLDDESFSVRAQGIGALVSKENGAEVAAMAVTECLDSLKRVS